MASCLRQVCEPSSAAAARISSVSRIEGGTDVGKNDKDNSGGGTTDGGRHDVGRDGQTGKTAEDINPKDYEQGGK